MRFFATALLILVALVGMPAWAAEEGARPDIVDVLTARLASASSVDEAEEIAAALRAVYGASTSASASVLFTHASTLEDEDDPVSIMMKLDRAIYLDDDLVAAYVLRGDARLEEGLIDQAFSDAMASVERAPDYYAGLGLLARAFEAQGRYASALATTREALRYYPLSEELAEQLARHRALAAGAGL